MLELLIAADPEVAALPVIDLNTLFSGGVGATLMAGIIFVVKLVADRTIPSRSDARANVTMLIEGLNNMVKVLQEEKTADAKRLADKQLRIESLETAADKDYDRISELRAEIIDLRNRLAQKDRHINTLVSELRKVGAQVTGLELSDMEGDIEITLPGEVSRRATPPKDAVSSSDEATTSGR